MHAFKLNLTIMNKLISSSKHLLLLFFVSMGVLHPRLNRYRNSMLKNILATSPEAAMLGRFGDIPISYYTGTADVSIPLYTIKKKPDWKCLFVLRYHGSGVKVDDEATNVDWDGAWSRVVHHSGDQRQAGWV